MGRRAQDQQKLNLMGIETALHLAECSSWVIRKHFNVVLERTARELRGEPCLALEEFSPTKQQIICSRSSAAVSPGMTICTGRSAPMPNAPPKLREEKQFCCYISVFIRTSPHAEDEVLW